MKKSAFTIAEILLSMAVIGIVATFATYAVKTYDKGIKFRYSNLYHAIDRAYYNAHNFNNNLRQPFSSEKDASGNDISNAERVARVCDMLTEYLNYTEKHCDSIRNGGFRFANSSGTEFGDVALITNTGMHFYLSNVLPDDYDPVVDHKFILIYVDINGPNTGGNTGRGPDSMRYIAPTPANHNKTGDPDIFAFAALDTGGRVCPLGLPEIFPRYMTTRMSYYNQSQGDGNDENEDADLLYTRVSEPYFITKAKAWGYYINEKDKYTPAGMIQNEENPYMYNDYIRSKLPEGNMIYPVPFFPAKPDDKFFVPAGIQLLDGRLDAGECCDCSEASDEVCNVIIDKYVY